MIHIINYYYIDIKDLDIVIKKLTSDQHLPFSVWQALGLQLGLYDDRLKDITIMDNQWSVSMSVCLPG